MEIVQCTANELNEIVRRFREALESEIPDSEATVIDTIKIVATFENRLRQRVQIVQSQKEYDEAQELKNQIEKMQRKAMRLKSTLTQNKNLFIDKVREQIEQILDNQRPTIELEEIPSPPKELPEKAKQRFQVLDECISKLSNQIKEVKTQIDTTIMETKDFPKEIHSL